MAQLPTPGQNAGQWGTLLNEFLQVSHMPDGAPANVIADVASLKALSAAQAATLGTVFMKGYHTPGDGGGGMLHWDAAATAADDTGTVFAPDAGGTGRWRRQAVGHIGYVDFRWFGAQTLVESVSYPDNIGVLEKVIDFANANNGNMTVVVVGNYYFSSAPASLPAIKKSRVRFRGSNKEESQFLFRSGPDSTGAYFKFGDPGEAMLEGGGLSDLALICVYADSTNPLVLMENSARVDFHDLRIQNCGTFLTVGTDANGAHSVWVTKMLGVPANVGRPFFKLVNGTGFTCNDMSSFYHIDAIHPTFDTTSVMNTLPGTNVFDIVGNWDTADIAIMAQKMYRVVNIDTPVTKNAYCIRIHDCVMDYIRENVIHVSASGGAISAIDISNNYFNSWEGYSIFVYSGSWLKNTNIANNFFLWSGKAAIIVSGAASVTPEHTQIHDNTIGSAGRLDANGYDAITIGADVGEFSITNNLIRLTTPGMGIPWVGATWGIGIQGYNHDNFAITGNNTYYLRYLDPDPNPANSYASDRSPRRRVSNNTITDVHTYAGYRSGAPFLLPASGVAWYNNSPFRVEVMIGGGTVSALTRNGQTLPFVSATLTLEPGDRFSVTYTAAPTVLFNVLP